MISRYWQCSAAAIAMSLMTTQAYAQASTGETSGDQAALALPSQNLGDALARIEARFGVQLDYDKAAIRTFRSSAVVDARRADDAVFQALAGTGLTATRSADGQTIGIGKPDPARLASDIVVTAPRSQAETSYKADASNTADRSGAPSKSLPFTSSVVTAQVLKDQQAQTIDDALRNVGSSKTALGNVQGVETYQVRGFVANVLTNGTQTAQGVYQPIDAVERVEVLKGPAAILQGQGALGGAVNVVAKKPTTTKLLNVELQAGSYDEFKGAIDASTPLGEDSRWSARMIGSGYSQGRTYGGYAGGYQILLAPSLRYKDSKLDATIGVVRSEQRTPTQPYTQFTTDTHALVDRNGAVAFDDQRFEFRTTSVNTDVSYQATPWLTFVARGTYTRLESEFYYFLPFTRLTSTNPTVIGLRAGLATKFATTTGDAYARAKFNTGPVRHTLSAGYNRTEGPDDRISLAGADGRSDFQSINFLADAPLGDFGVAKTSGDNIHDYTRSYGYYLQDLIEYGPLHLFGALRRNLYSIRTQTGTSAPTGYSDRAWTPSGGAVIDLNKSISLYANYSKGFVPGDVFDAAGNRLPPVKSTQFEGGTKIDFNQSRASLTLSAFQITEFNRPMQISRTASVLAGGLRSRGLEGELTGEILPGWNVTLSGTRSWYTYVPQDSVTLSGDPYSALVKARGSLWTVYTIRKGPLAHLGFGGGLTAQSSSIATGLYVAATNSYYGERVPGFTRADASIYYRLGPVDMALGVRNLFDGKNYGEANLASFVPVLSPRTFRLTLTYHAF